MTHTNYTKHAPHEEPVTRTFRLAPSDWDRLTYIRDQLQRSHGLKLSLNATLIHVLHQQGRGVELADTSVSQR